MAIHLVRIHPENDDYTTDERNALIARRQAQNEKVMALALGESDCVPIFDLIPVIPGLPNNPVCSDADFRTSYVLYPWEAERSLGNSIDEVAKHIREQVHHQKAKLVDKYRIHMADDEIPGYYPGETQNMVLEFQKNTAAELATLQTEDAADADLWWSSAARWCAGMSAYLQSIGKDLDWLLETNHAGE